MGIFDAIFKHEASADLSTVSETVDTVVHHYIEIKKIMPGSSDEDIYKKIIELRYAAAPLEDKEDYDRLLSKTKYFNGLTMLITNILMTESDTSGMSEEQIGRLMQNISEVVEKRLKKHNLNINN